MAKDWTLHLFKPTVYKTWYFFESMDKFLKNLGVAVDRHGVTVFDLPFVPGGKGPNSNLTNPQYRYLASIYQEVADMFGYLWHEAQAMVWLWERKRKGVKV